MAFRAKVVSVSITVNVSDVVTVAVFDDGSVFLHRNDDLTWSQLPDLPVVLSSLDPLATSIDVTAVPLEGMSLFGFLTCTIFEDGSVIQHYEEGPEMPKDYIESRIVPGLNQHKTVEAELDGWAIIRVDLAEDVHEI